MTTTITMDAIGVAWPSVSVWPTETLSAGLSEPTATLKVPMQAGLNQPTSAPASVGVTERVTQTPSSVLALPLGESSVRITWSCTDEPNVLYEIAMAVNDINNKKSIIARTPNTAIVIKGLPVDVSMFFWVRTYLSLNIYGTFVAAMKAKVAPSQPIQLQVTALTGTQIMKTMQFPFVPVGGGVSYLSLTQDAYM